MRHVICFTTKELETIKDCLEDNVPDLDGTISFFEALPAEQVKESILEVMKLQKSLLLKIGNNLDKAIKTKGTCPEDCND